MLTRRIGGYLNDRAFAEQSPAEFAGTTLPPEVVNNFIAFAAQEGVDEVEMRAYRQVVHEMLLRTVARGRWGASGYYALAALHDSDVHDAISQFNKAVGPIGRS